MSDLANSCEYFTAEKTCDLPVENQKVMTNRQAKCESAEKMSCCYLCSIRAQCAISCKYLGNPDVAYVPVGPEKTAIETAIEQPRELPQAPMANNQAQFCIACNVEMSESKTELRVDRWTGAKPPMPSADILPVVVYLCPQCGKIEFKADRQAIKEEIEEP